VVDLHDASAADKPGLCLAHRCAGGSRPLFSATCVPPISRWPNGIECPRCGTLDSYALAKKPHHCQVAAKCLPLYVAEFEFRNDNLLNDDILGAAVAEV